MPLTLRQKSVLAAAIAVGLALGVGTFTFGYAKGASYLTNDPAACANCHVMSEHLAAWEKGSHRAVATCNDCHTPHNLVGKYTTKALNGFWHSFYFTTGNYPDPLRITERNHKVTEQACRYCHQQVVEEIDPVHGASQGREARTAARFHDGDAVVQQAGTTASVGHADERISCIRCHTYVGHWVR